MGVENVNPREELKRLEEQVKAATQLADLKPIYFRLNEIIKQFAGDFDVWVAGNDLKQLLVARGTLIQQGEVLAKSGSAPAAANMPEISAFQPGKTVERPPAPHPPAAGGAAVPPVISPRPTGIASGPSSPTLRDAASPGAPANPVSTSREVPVPPAGSPRSTTSREIAVPPVGPPRPSAASRESAVQPPAAPPRTTGTTPGAPPSLTSSILDFGPPSAPLTPSVKPPPRTTAGVPALPGPPVRPSGPPRKINPLVFIVAGAAVVTALVIILVVMYRNHLRETKLAAARTAAVQVSIATAPPGALVKLVGSSRQASCTSNCKLSLPPGTYEISATLHGYESTVSSVVIAPQHPAALNLTLQPQAPSVRLLTDLATGTAEVDNEPPVPLQEGQLVLDKLTPGAHTVKVRGANGSSSASFSVDIGEARQPTVNGPVVARNMMAVLVASFGRQARVVTSAGPWKLAVNGQPQPDATPAGTDLTSFQEGVNEIDVGEGKDQRSLSESFGAAPTLTAFLKTDVDAGTLIVSTGLDGVRVFVNDKEQSHQTQRGQLRLLTLGKVTVRVAKTGFLEPPPQSVEIKKGAEMRVQFDLKPAPQFGSLEIRGAAPGMEIWLDQRNTGSVGADGTFGFGSVQPGEHSIELRREQYLPKRLQRLFVAGQTVELTGADVVLTLAEGIIHFTRDPAPTLITYHRDNETERHEVHGSQLELPPGGYMFSGSAPGFVTLSVHLIVAAGQNHEMTFNLVREKPVAPPPPTTHGMSDFSELATWTKDGDNWVHKGGGFQAYKLTPKGTFTFTVQLIKGGSFLHGGEIRWCVQYLNPQNYLLTEVDRKNFSALVIRDGEKLYRVKKAHNLGNQKAFTVQLDIAPDHLIQSLLIDNKWITFDQFREPGRDYTQGKFGFLIQGNDEIAISDFKFVPK